MQPILKNRRSILILLVILGLLITSITFSTVTSETPDEALNKIKDTYNGVKFKGNLLMAGNFPAEVAKVRIMFFFGTNQVMNETKNVQAGRWSFTTDVSTWAEGEYDVTIFSLDNSSNVNGQKEFKIKIESGVEAGIKQGQIFDSAFIKKYKDDNYLDDLKMSKSLPDDVDSVQVKITKGDEVKVDQTANNLQNSWSFETSVKDWKTGKYNVILIAKAANGTTLDTASFQIEVVDVEPYDMPLVCGVMLVIFIIIAIVLFILYLLKNKKVLSQLKFDPKSVAKKLPGLSIISMFLSLLLIIGWTGIAMTAGLDVITFILFLIVLGLGMLVTLWAFYNRNLVQLIFFIIFIVISLVVAILGSIWSEEDAFGLIMASEIILIGLIIYFISILLYWLTSRRGIFFALVVMILSLVFMILQIIFIVLSAIEFMPWWLSAVLGSILIVLILILCWLMLREDIFYFEIREESKTHRGYRKTMNMFDILGTPRGLFKRDYDRKVMGKISYEETHDKKVRMEVISVRDWSLAPGRNQGRRLMGVFTKKMRSKEGPPFNKEPVAEAVKYTIYSSDVNLDDKISLCKAFGFEVQDSGRERGLDYFDLELVHRPFLGLGKPMGSTKKKKDYDKESGYAKDSDSEKDADREHRYDYERDREREREEERRREREDLDRQRERERERERDRYRDRGRDKEPEDDLEDWSRPKRDRDRGRGRNRGRARERDRDRAPPEKPKKRPPPPRIVSD
jgi:hypothetical protein